METTVPLGSGIEGSLATDIAFWVIGISTVAASLTSTKVYKIPAPANWIGTAAMKPDRSCCRASTCSPSHC